MTSNERPKPIQIRLPQALEDSLRLVASRSKSTLNSIVIDCLQENLPAVHPLDLAVISGVSPFPKTIAQLRLSALDRLNRYEAAVQLQLDVILQIASILNAQSSLARSMSDSLVKGYSVQVPEDRTGALPDLPSPEGTISAKLLQYIDASKVVKNIEALKAGRKQASRHQYDAVGEWEAVKELLKRLADAESSDAAEG